MFFSIDVDDCMEVISNESSLCYLNNRYLLRGNIHNKLILRNYYLIDIYIDC